MKNIIICILLVNFLAVHGQESNSVFNFMNLPTSAHTVALGGNNISLIEDDASLALQNPALLASVSNNSINFNFMSYMKGTNTGSFAYVRTQKERGTWGVATQFVGYGDMKETTEMGDVVGDFNALDMDVRGMYSYNLSDKWVGGATGHFIYSKLGNYTSIGMAVDLGLNYYDEDHDVSISAVCSNLGGQVKAYADTHEKLPYNLQFGFTKGIAHAPVRISVTMVDINHWNKDFYYNANKKVKGGSMLMNHFNLGIDVLPTSIMYISAGYNMRRAYEMKAAGKSHAAGLSFGAGILLKRIKVGLGYAKYHVSSHTMALSMSTNF